MKILYLITRLDNKGPVNQLYSLIKAICNNGRLAKSQMIIVTIYEENGDSRKKDFEELGIEIISLRVSGKYSLVNAKKKLAELIGTIKPDIIHSATLPADIVAGITNRGRVRWCSTLHCNIYNDYKERFSGFKALAFINAHRMILKRADSIICCSNSILDIYKGRKWKKVCSIQNGIDVEKQINCENADVEVLRQKLSLDLDRKIALVVGSIDNRKNTEYILENYIKADNKDMFSLVLLGEGPRYEELRNRFSDFVDFRGKINNVEEYLNSADIYISASKSEGLPLSVIEAGCAGLEMWLSTINPHKEIAEGVNISNICFFDIADKEGLKSLFDKYNDVSKSSHSKSKISNEYKKAFSSEKMADLYLLEYERLQGK